MSDADARFSLVAGEGDGAILGLAAGDAAGGAWELGYSAVTEQATVIAYHLIEHGSLQVPALVEGLRELDGNDGDEPVYRSESAHFRAWLDGPGGPVQGGGPTLDSAPRSVPVGSAFRREPEVLLEESIALGRLFSTDGRSVLSGVVTAGAVAASCFGQSGRDLISGVIEMVEPAVPGLGVDTDVISELAGLREHVGVTDGEGALALSTTTGERGPWELVKAGLLLACPVLDRPHVPIEQAARIGGSPLAATVGGVVGARVGIRAWPWAFANDTWFAEIGRRLVRGPREVVDLPIPYAVEHHLIAGERQGLY